ncbi:MAG TPA: alanine racemase [Cyclobacteriaceae bacterium]|nr:alanine racemase [Cyclobacteriaceae bacterium]
MTISTPTLLLDEVKCRANINIMAAKARKHKLVFRPHFKTHQNLSIGRWFKEEGVKCITVSSLSMAEYFSNDWDDITVAFPVNILEIDTINKLSLKIKLNLLVESIAHVNFLKQHLAHTAGIFIKIDVGYHRTGISADNEMLMDQVISIIQQSPKLKFKGFLAHAGHTYKCRKQDEVIAIHQSSLRIMSQLKSKYQTEFPDLITSLGDTPSCSMAEDFSGLDEIRPGNFVFYDLSQVRIGSCTSEQIAVAMACPIVALHKERHELVIYGGAVHFSKDRLEEEAEGTIYGRVAEKSGRGWGEIITGMYVKNLSQEHGIIKVPEEKIKSYQVGDILLILPVHSCLTAQCVKTYHTLGFQKL